MVSLGADEPLLPRRYLDLFIRIFRCVLRVANWQGNSSSQFWPRAQRTPIERSHVALVFPEAGSTGCLQPVRCSRRKHRDRVRCFWSLRDTGWGNRWYPVMMMAQFVKQEVHQLETFDRRLVEVAQCSLGVIRHGLALDSQPIKNGGVPLDKFIVPIRYQLTFPRTDCYNPVPMPSHEASCMAGDAPEAFRC